ncbi:4-aminobutyrate--2-oxoglutarate transaminase [Balneatrix alpica]|uniref:4-aminobutyrate--2-oxoglutarate transaminase n=1 Tax=Balneatrix alpica TaxID=75684 RepID=UPI0027398555|nr:4-aminobutyrate--2-oxoglutarate transaminase [Balneatrix alpica]
MTTNTHWQALRERYVPKGVGNMLQAYAERAENAQIWDVEGNAYLDFAGGIGVLNVGHRHPKVVAAVQQQLDKLMHTCFHVMPYAPYVELAKRLSEAAPGPSLKQTLLVNTGAEAVENAIKIARAATGRSGVVAFSGAFHGRTLMGMALTGKMAPYKQGFGPFPAEVYRVPYPNPYHGCSEEDSLTALHTLFKMDIDPKRVAALIIEPVQGEGGFYAATPSFMQSLRQLCDQHGILLIVDEVQSGFARTGKLFAIEHAGIEPDLMTVAKSLAGGMPLAGVIGKASLMNVPEPGALGSTYGGNPLSCAAALAVLDVIEEEHLLERAEQVGELIESGFTTLAKDFAAISHIRRLGAMAAMELLDAEGRPDAALAKALTQKAASKGLLLLSCGVYANTIRVLVPLTATDQQIQQGMGIIGESLAELFAC